MAAHRTSLFANSVAAGAAADHSRAIGHPRDEEFEELPKWMRQQVTQPGGTAPAVAAPPPEITHAQTHLPTVGGVPLDQLPAWYRQQIEKRVGPLPRNSSAPQAVSGGKSSSSAATEAHGTAGQQPQQVEPPPLVQAPAKPPPPPAAAPAAALTAPTTSAASPPLPSWDEIQARLAALRADMPASAQPPPRRGPPPSLTVLQSRLDALRGRDPSKPLPTAVELNTRLYALSDGRHGQPTPGVQTAEAAAAARQPLPTQLADADNDLNELWAQLLDEAELEAGLPPGSLSMPAGSVAEGDDGLTASTRADPADDNLRLTPATREELQAFIREAEGVINPTAEEREARRALEEAQALLARPINAEEPAPAPATVGQTAPQGPSSTGATQSRAADDTASLNDEAMALVEQAVAETRLEAEEEAREVEGGW